MQRLVILIILLMGVGPAMGAKPTPVSESAKTLIEGIKKQLSAGQYAPAIVSMEALYRLNPKPVILFNIAVATDKLESSCGERVSAYRRFLDECKGCRSESLGRERLATTYAKCGYGTLKVAAKPADATIFVDGTMMGQSPVNTMVAPGPHKIEIKHKTGETGREIVMPKQGERVLNLSIVPRATSTQSSASQVTEPGLEGGVAAHAEPATGRAPWLQYSLIGGGTVLSGIGLAIFMVGKTGAVEAKDSGNFADYKSGFEEANSLQQSGVALMSIGLTTAVTGVVWWVSQSDRGALTDGERPRDEGVSVGFSRRFLSFQGRF